MLGRQPFLVSVKGVSDIRQSKLGDEPILLGQHIQHIQNTSSQALEMDENGVLAYPFACRIDVQLPQRSWNRMFAFQIIWSEIDEELKALQLALCSLEMLNTKRQTLIKGVHRNLTVLIMFA